MPTSANVGCSGLLVNVGPMPAITWATPIATAAAKAPTGKRRRTTTVPASARLAGRTA